MHSSTERRDGDHALLPVVSPLIVGGGHPLPSETDHVPEIHPMLGKVADPLALVPLELHTHIVCKICPAGKP